MPRPVSSNFTDSSTKRTGRSDHAAQGNILVPAFTVGRTQDLLYLMAEHHEAWGLGNWDIFLDSPMGISATKVYSRYRNLFAAQLFEPKSDYPELPNLYATRSVEESMAINKVESGAIIIARFRQKIVI
jgi:metallo-beta-lactamase family protein